MAAVGTVIRVLKNGFIARMADPGPVAGVFQVLHASDSSVACLAKPLFNQDGSNCQMVWSSAPTKPLAAGDTLQVYTG